jgi:hypothetical protein
MGCLNEILGVVFRSLDLRAGSSAKIGLVLYQYTAAIARPHRKAEPFHVPDLAAGPAKRKRLETDRDGKFCRPARKTRGADRSEERSTVAMIRERSDGQL